MERFAFIMLRVQLPESKMETPSTLTPICWVPVPTYLTTTKEWRSMITVKVTNLMRQVSFLMPVVMAITKSILSFQTVVLGGKYINALSGVKNIV